MIPVIKIYMTNYHDAKRLFNTLYRPAIDKAIDSTETDWDSGIPMVIERPDECYYIFSTRYYDELER